MAKYYDNLEEQSSIHTNSGTEIEVPPGFHEMSSIIISRCSLLQSQIQQVIYATHGAEVFAAKKALADFPSPKSRIEFLLSFPYGEDDPVFSAVFDYARGLFEDIYNVRNVLAHENWKTSKEFSGVVIFSSINEEAKLMLASGKLAHGHETTPQKTYDATIRYISKIKLISCANLQAAIRDANLCSWILMNISNVLGEEDVDKKDELRSTFRLFKGTSHLFDEQDRISGTITVQSFKNKSIQG